MSVESTMDELKSLSGDQFDPLAVDAFLRVLARHGGSLLMAEAEVSSHLGAAVASAGDAIAKEEASDVSAAARRSAAGSGSPPHGR